MIGFKPQSITPTCTRSNVHSLELKLAISVVALLAFNVTKDLPASMIQTTIATQPQAVEIVAESVCLKELNVTFLMSHRVSWDGNATQSSVYV
mmetsp:Transcript_10070/g.16203  ORF Transcript_10070/g.16203 Transcript_10070/m.16203 type:complete len:93 (+) Transcript_10070:412-690(+)